MPSVRSRELSASCLSRLILSSMAFACSVSCVVHVFSTQDVGYRQGVGRYRRNGNAEPEEEGFGDLVAAPARCFLWRVFWVWSIVPDGS